MRSPNMGTNQAADVMDRSDDRMADESPSVVTSTSAVRRFISDMPLETQRSFTSNQLREMSKALTRRYHQGPFVNYHKSVLGFFLTVYAGREKRCHRRLRIDRLKHQNLSLGNLSFLGFWGLAALSVAHLLYTAAS